MPDDDLNFDLADWGIDLCSEPEVLPAPRRARLIEAFIDAGWSFVEDGDHPDVDAQLLLFRLPERVDGRAVSVSVTQTEGELTAMVWFDHDTGRAAQPGQLLESTSERGLAEDCSALVAVMAHTGTARLSPF